MNKIRLILRFLFIPLWIALFFVYEGAIDFTVAEKILHDFETHESVIKPELDEYLCRFLDNYIRVLKVVVENKGIVYYS